MANIILKDRAGQPVEYNGIETIEAPKADVTIVPEMEFSGFAYDEYFGLYIVDINPSPLTLEVGEKYEVIWDGATFICECQDLSAMSDGALGIGNLADFGGAGNGEPFVVAIVDGVAMLASFTEGVKHTVTIAKIGGTQIFSEGVAVEMPTPIPLDFSAGNQTITAPEGYLVKSAILQKPNALVSENIAKDVNIAGVVGTYAGGGSSDDVRYVTFMNGGVELYVKPVAVGDDCVDVLTKGFINTPTKDSTAQTVYTYSGWALTNGDAANASALKNVTENRTVYAAYTESVRHYTISYYDEGTLIKTESLPYGTTPSYAPTKEGYTFTGWTPEAAAVTGDASYYANWIEKYDFASLTWDQISEISESGEADKAFELGAKKTFSYKAYGSTYTGVAEIVGFNHDDRADGQGKAGITLRLNGCTDELEGIQSGSSNKSWDTCEGRVSGGVAMYNDYSKKGYGVENALYNVIKPVTKKFYHWANGTMSTITDGLFLPSMTELGYNMANPEGEAYELFATKNKVLGAAYPELISKNNAGVARGYWTRTKSGNYHFHTISTAGASASIDQAISGKYARVYYTCV